MAYNANVTTTTDPAGVTHTRTTDALGRLSEVTENGIGATTRYRYDVLDNLTRVCQGGNWGAGETCVGGQLRVFQYDSLGRLSSSLNPEHDDAECYTYYDDGNPKTKEDARDIVTTHLYDELDRPTSTTYSDLETPPVSYLYDNPAVPFWRGRLTQVSNGVSITKITAYDALGRVAGSSQNTDNLTYSFGYSYNANDSLKTQTYPSGSVVAFDYDNAGRPVRAGLNTVGVTQYIQSVSYAPHGAPTATLLGNNLTESTAFNSRLQPCQISAGSLLTLSLRYSPGDTGCQNLTGNNGNLQSQVITAPAMPTPITLTQTYTYDGVNRLSSITETGGATDWNRAYYYDPYGNRAAQGQDVFANTPQCALSTDPNCSASHFDSANNRLTAAWVSYDSGGNQTAFNVTGFQWSAGYDANNLQRFYCAGTAAACTAANASAEYQYDGDGRRAKKVQGARTTVFVYDAFGNLAAEYDTQPDPNLVAGTYYRTTDHLGSTRLVTDGDGAVVSRRDFFPFGEEIPANTTFGNRQQVTDGNPFTTYNQEFGVYQKFTGKERDGESGLDYFGARYLASTRGAFQSPDPLLNSGKPWEPQSWNRYAYVDNNPLRYTDPAGLFKWAKKCDEVPGSACKDERDRFREALENAKKAAEGLEKGSEERKELEKALKKIGEEGKGSTRIAFGDAENTGGKPNLAITDRRTITFNLNAIDATANGNRLSTAERSVFDAALLGHEGSHLGFSIPFLGIYFTRGENKALFGHSAIYQGSSTTDRVFGLWNQSWATIDRTLRELNRNNAIQTELNRQAALPK